MEIKKWLGLKNTTAPERLKPGELSVAQNVDLDNEDRLLSRAGVTRIQPGPYHSIWSDDKTCYVMVGQDMKRMRQDGSLEQITRLTSGRRVCFHEVNGVIYFTNGTDTGRIVNGQALEWGIKPPISQPVAAPYPGRLPAGRYLYAMTFVRHDGQESGTGHPGSFELEAPGGILLTNLEISTNQEVSGKIVYLSAANGRELYRVAVLPPNATTFTYMNGGYDEGAVLDTMFVEPAPPGRILETHSGIFYVVDEVDGNVVWHSDAYGFERFRRAESRFLQFPGRVALFSAVSDGIYVATESATWFLQGDSPSDLKSRQVLTYGAIEGTAVKFDVEELNKDGEPTGGTKPAVMWTTPNGIVVGQSGGVVRNMTENKYGFPAAQRGAGILRDTKGFTQYLSTLQGTGSAPNSYE